MANNSNNSQPSLQETAPANSEIAQLTQLAQTQSKQISDLISLMTANLQAQAAAPAAAPVQMAPVIQPQVTIRQPSRRDNFERDQAIIEARSKKADDDKASRDADLQEGQEKFEVCVMYGEGAGSRITNQVRIVGARDQMHAQLKYAAYYGITGVTFPARYNVKPLQPAGMADMLGSRSV